MRILEDEIIDRIRRRIPSSPGGVLRVGIGHDAAIIRPDGRDWVITCDQFLEGVHFLIDRNPPESVGYKALTRATSDLVAMAAQPRVFLMSIVLPPERTGRWLSRMLSGMARASKLYGLSLAGGDTARAPKKNGSVSLNLTVLGDVPQGGAIGRAGAKPGDRIYVTGVLGQAQLGLELLMSSKALSHYRKILTTQYYPILPLDFALWMGRNYPPTAMMDISDGLSTDLTRLCRASRVGAIVYANRVPAVQVPESLVKSRKFDSLRLALNGGDDYGLLFTVAKKIVPHIPAVFGRTRVTCIGEIVRGSEVKIVTSNGQTAELRPAGWDHFLKH